MSDEEKKESPAPAEGEAKGGAFAKMNLKAATNKVNAEALRQFQIDGEGRLELTVIITFSMKNYSDLRYHYVLKITFSKSNTLDSTAERARVKAEQEEAARLKAEQDAAEAETEGTTRRR